MCVDCVSVIKVSYEAKMFGGISLLCDSAQKLFLWCMLFMSYIIVFFFV